MHDRTNERFKLMILLFVYKIISSRFVSVTVQQASDIFAKISRSKLKNHQQKFIISENNEKKN